MEKLVLPDVVKKLVVYGDPHGDLAGVEKVYRAEDGAGTLFCCVGDVVGYVDGPTSSRLCRFFMERGTPTVEGNHEDWVSPKRQLAIGDGRGDRQLDQDAFEWIRSLPKRICFTRSDGETLALLTHSIRRGGWDWIDEHNAIQFAKYLDSPRVILVGHSHRPKFISIDDRGKVSRESFDYHQVESLAKPVPTGGTLLIDAGSVARPESTEIAGSKFRHDGRRYGTYAVLDLDAELASLKRIIKDE